MKRGACNGGCTLPEPDGRCLLGGRGNRAAMATRRLDEEFGEPVTNWLTDDESGASR